MVVIGICAAARSQGRVRISEEWHVADAGRLRVDGQAVDPAKDAEAMRLEGLQAHGIALHDNLRCRVRPRVDADGLRWNWLVPRTGP